MQKKNKANLALGLSAAGFLGTMSWSGFLPAMLHHGFIASTIGGLADWFAVTAIFHKPLGISYRTDILRRNRERIMDAIVTFASDDLLSTKNIMSVINTQDTAKLMADYLSHRGGREKVHEVVDTILLKAVNDMDTRAIADELAPAIREGLNSLALENLLTSLMQMLAEEKHSTRILASLLTIGQQVLASPAFKTVLLEHIEILRKNYEKDSAGRAFILSSLGFTNEKIMQIIVTRLQNKMQDMLSRQSESYAGVKAAMETMFRSFSHDERLQEILRDKKEQLLAAIDINGFLVRWMEWNLKGENPFWLKNINAFIDDRIDAFITSPVWQHHFDSFLKNFLGDELNKHHNLIPGIIRERLAEFSDVELVAFVESKVQDDLQMIRINGSVVGAMVGMGLYLLVTLAERMWGL